MTELAAFVPLGLRHITDPAALDHLLFLVALAAIYHGREWRGAVRVVSAFTVGHSLTLALVASGAASIPVPLIEFLIPLTIVATGLHNLTLRRQTRSDGDGRYRPLLAGGFGLIHGAGFAGYLQQLFTGPIVLPLLGFNLGIELGQLLVLAAAGLALAAVDRVLAPGHRTVLVSAVVVLLAADMALERLPW